MVLSYGNIYVRVIFNSTISILVLVFVVLSIVQKKISKENEPKQQTPLPDLLQEDIKQITKITDAEENLEKTKDCMELKQCLLKYFEQKQPYLNPNLKIDDLCIYLNTNRSYLSKIINNEFGMNFYHFINQYRIQSAKKLLSDKKNGHYTIKAVSEMSGFKSVSTFNKSFKETEGNTPSDFRKNL